MNNSSTYYSLPLKSNAPAVSRKESAAFEKHQQLMKEAVREVPHGYPPVLPEPNAERLSEVDILKRNHEFLREADGEVDDLTQWGTRLARKYYDRLFKEYCLGDFSRYKTGALGLRWRVKEEVIQGKGQFMCGNLKCSNVVGLLSWEVPFAYFEHGARKNTLVKIRLCPDCSYKLNYRKHKEDNLKRKEEKLARRAAVDPADLEDHPAPSKEDLDVQARSREPMEKRGKEDGVVIEEEQLDRKKRKRQQEISTKAVRPVPRVRDLEEEENEIDLALNKIFDEFE